MIVPSLKQPHLTAGFRTEQPKVVFQMNCSSFGMGVPFQKEHLLPFSACSHSFSWLNSGVTLCLPDFFSTFNSKAIPETQRANMWKQRCSLAPYRTKWNGEKDIGSMGIAYGLHGCATDTYHQQNSGLCQFQGAKQKPKMASNPVPDLTFDSHIYIYTYLYIRINT